MPTGWVGGDFEKDLSTKGLSTEVWVLRAS